MSRISCAELRKIRMVLRDFCARAVSVFEVFGVFIWRAQVLRDFERFHE